MATIREKVRITLLQGLSFLICALWLTPGLRGEENEVEIPVSTTPVVTKPYREYGVFFGKIMGFNEADLITYQPGRVNRVLVKSGDKVKKGQSLCDIDAKMARVSLDSATLSEKIAKKDYERIRLHVSKGGASQLQFEKEKLRWLNAKRQLLDAQKMHRGSRCISPLNGIVVGVSIQKFQDLPAGRLTISLARLDKVKLLVDLPESEAMLYDRGRVVSVTLASARDQVWQGSIDSISLKVDERNRTFSSEVHVKNDKKLTLKPGLTAKVKILKYQFSDKIVIPAEAIVTRNRETYVMVVADGRARKQKVSILAQSSEDCVIAKGLTVGDQLITRGQHQVSDGVKVTVFREKMG